MILQGGVQISLRRVTGVARFAEEGKVSQAEMSNQCPIGEQPRLVACGQLPGMGKNCGAGQSQHAKHSKGKIGRAH